MHLLTTCCSHLAFIYNCFTKFLFASLHTIFCSIRLMVDTLHTRFTCNIVYSVPRSDVVYVNKLCCIKLPFSCSAFLLLFMAIWIVVFHSMSFLPIVYIRLKIFRFKINLRVLKYFKNGQVFFSRIQTFHLLYNKLLDTRENIC